MTIRAIWNCCLLSIFSFWRHVCCCCCRLWIMDDKSKKLTALFCSLRIFFLLRMGMDRKWWSNNFFSLNHFLFPAAAAEVVGTIMIKLHTKYHRCVRQDKTRDKLQRQYSAESWKQVDYFFQEIERRKGHLARSKRERNTKKKTRGSKRAQRSAVRRRRTSAWTRKCAIHQIQFLISRVQSLSVKELCILLLLLCVYIFGGLSWRRWTRARDMTDRQHHRARAL